MKTGTDDELFTGILKDKIGEHLLGSIYLAFTEDDVLQNAIDAGEGGNIAFFVAVIDRAVSDSVVGFFDRIICTHNTMI